MGRCLGFHNEESPRKIRGTSEMLSLPSPPTVGKEVVLEVT